MHTNTEHTDGCCAAPRHQVVSRWHHMPLSLQQRWGRCILLYLLHLDLVVGGANRDPEVAVVRGMWKCIMHMHTLRIYTQVNKSSPALHLHPPESSKRTVLLLIWVTSRVKSMVWESNPESNPGRESHIQSHIQVESHIQTLQKKTSNSNFKLVL